MVLKINVDFILCISEFIQSYIYMTFVNLFNIFDKLKLCPVKTLYRNLTKFNMFKIHDIVWLLVTV